MFPIVHYFSASGGWGGGRTYPAPSARDLPIRSAAIFEGIGTVGIIPTGIQKPRGLPNTYTEVNGFDQ